MDQQKSWTKEGIRLIKTVRFGGATGSVVCNSYCVCVNWSTHTGMYTYDVFIGLLGKGSLVIVDGPRVQETHTTSKRRT